MDKILFSKLIYPNKSTMQKILLFIILILLPFTLLNTKFIIVLLTLTLIYAIAAIGLNILMGFAGQISIGHAAFMAIGAYSSALISYHFKIGFIPSFLLSGIIAGFFGLILGLPALRLKGFYLAITTMGFGIATIQILSSWEALTKGHSGLTQDMIITPDIFGLQITNDLGNYFLVVLIFFIIYLFSKNLELSKYGRNFKAIRDTDVAASTSGINTTYYKLLAFIISSILAGFGGSLYAHIMRYLNPINFGLDLSLNLVAMIIIGGIGSIEGAILGAFFLTILSQLFTRINFPPSILNGLAIVLIMLFLPQGLISLYFKYKIKKQNKINPKNIKLKLKNGNHKFIMINNYKLHYIKSGSGPINILFIHGNTASANWWIKPINLFDKQKYSLYALTLPGFGESSRINFSSKKVSIDFYATLVHDFINKLSLNKIILIGHSLGGIICQLLILKYPKLFLKLVLVDSGPPESIKTPKELFPVITSLINNPQKLLQSLKMSLLKLNDNKYLNFALNEALKMQDILFLGNVYALNNFNLNNKIKELKINFNQFNIPLLLIRGKYDPIITEDMINSFKKYFKNTTIRIFNNSSHAPFIEETINFVKVVDNFIENK